MSKQGEESVRELEQYKQSLIVLKVGEKGIRASQLQDKIDLCDKVLKLYK